MTGLRLEPEPERPPRASDRRTLEVIAIPSVAFCAWMLFLPRLSSPLMLLSIGTVCVIVALGAYRRGATAALLMVLLAFPAMVFRALRIEAIVAGDLKSHLSTAYTMDSFVGPLTLVPIGVLLAGLGFVLAPLFARSPSAR